MATHASGEQTPPRNPEPRAVPVLRTYKPKDEEQLVGMLGDAFTFPNSVENWRWWYRLAPAGPAVTHLLEVEGGRLVGHMAHQPFDTWIRGQRARVGIGGWTVMVRGYQGPRGMKILIDGFLSSEHGFDARMNFPGERAAPLMERYGLGTVIGHLPRWVRSRGRGASLPTPFDSLVGAAGTVMSRAAAAPAPRLRVESLSQTDPSFDELAAESAGFAPAVRVRDGAYLRWRWLDAPHPQWLVRCARTRSGQLCGWAVLGDRGRDDGHGEIVDLLARDPKAIRALLIDAYRVLRSRGCTGVSIVYHDPRPWVRHALVRSGYFPASAEAPVMVKTLSDLAGPELEQLGSWYLTAGDVDTV